MSTMIFLSLLLFGTAASIDLSAAERAADVATAYVTGQHMPARFARSADPVALSVQSSQDGAGPPWSPRTLIFTGLATLGILALSQHLYLLAKRWGLRAVVEERAQKAGERFGGSMPLNH
jgi:hypothetical protein